MALETQRYGRGQCGTTLVAAQDVLHISPHQLPVSPRSYDHGGLQDVSGSSLQDLRSLIFAGAS